MASIIPAGVYGLRVPAGGQPVPATSNQSLALRITMAAVNPTTGSEGDKVGRATLKILRPQDDDEGDEDDDDFDADDVEAIRAKLREEGVLGSDDDSELSDEDDSDNEANGGPSDPSKSKKAQREALEKKLQEDLDAEEMEIDSWTNGINGKAKGKAKALDIDVSDSEDDDEESGEVEELVLCTLDTDKHYQQPLEITVREGEEIYFVSIGDHDIYLTGNYIAIDGPDDEDEDEHGMQGIDYDLSPDEDELDEDLSESEDDELDGLQDPRIAEIDTDEEEAPKLIKAGKKGKNKRPAESSEDEDGAATLDELISKAKAEAPATNGEQKLSKKQAKKLKNNEGQAVAAAESVKKDKVETPSSDKKKVQFAKNLEQGPSASPKVEEAKKETPKGPRTVSGVTIDDKKEGKGRAAKKGDRIEMRYIGKLKSNGKQFDANKKGKPFAFKLGVGEVIKGWDVGVAGMMAGSERRLTIPANLAYGKKGAPPDIPPNSDLIFDIKCISVN